MTYHLVYYDCVVAVDMDKGTATPAEYINVVSYMPDGFYYLGGQPESLIRTVMEILHCRLLPDRRLSVDLVKAFKNMTYSQALAILTEVDWV